MRSPTINIEILEYKRLLLNSYVYGLIDFIQQTFRMTSRPSRVPNCSSIIKQELFCLKCKSWVIVKER